MHITNQRDKQLIKAYLREYGEKYYQADIFKSYPETKFFPTYIARHFDQAKIVLDVGFGSGLWFWASFLPALERIDGLDLYPEALEEANGVFEVDQVPPGFREAHSQLGHIFTLTQLKQLKQKQGYFVFQDFRNPWPEEIVQTHYDLVTENGGGLGQLASVGEVSAVLQKIGQVLKPSGYFLFMNFMTEPTILEQKLGHVESPSWRFRPDLLKNALKLAKLKLVDFYVENYPGGTENRERFFYGYAQKR
jgi:SAM-dependent methyltransferase